MYTIGVDLGGTNIAIGLCDSELKIIDKGSVRTGADRDGELIIKDMAELAKTKTSDNNFFKKTSCPSSEKHFVVVFLKYFNPQRLKKQLRNL